MGGRASGMVRWLYGRAYLLLALTSLSWASNVVAGRLATAHVSPMAVVTLRWFIVVVLVGAFSFRQILADLPALGARWLWVCVLGAFGFTGFNALFYIAAYYTSGINMGILQATMPAFILLGGLVFFGTRIRLLQVGGVTLTLAAATCVASQGSLEILASLAFNRGDVLILGGCFCYAAYATFLAGRPHVAGISLFAGLACAAFVSSLPLLAVEYALGLTRWPDAAGWLIILHIAVFPSLLSQLFFMRGVELIGPGRAGIFTNLVPVLAPILGVLLLGESFQPYHAAAFVLVVGGIWLAERPRHTRPVGAGTPEPNISRR